MPFIPGVRGNLINLDLVAEIRPKPDGNFFVSMANGETRELPASVTDTIVQIIPVTGEWDALLLFDTGDDFDISPEPVIAWGLTLDGDTVPITAGCQEGVHKLSDAYGLRRRDDPAVEVPHDARYASADEWLTARREWRRKHAKPAAG